MSNSSENVLIVLHTGFHKTGTTALQSYLAKHRDVLADVGFSYPDFSKLILGLSEDGHFYFANKVACDYTDIEPMKQFLVKESMGAKTLFLSAESISRHKISVLDYTTREQKRAYLTRLAEALPEAEVEVMATLRNPYKLIASHYQEYVKKTYYSKPFSQYLGVYFENYDPITNLTLWKQVFHRVSLRGYEADCNHKYGIVGAVLADYAPNFKVDQGPQSLNVSLSTLSVEVLRRLNPYFKENGGKRDVLYTLSDYSREKRDEDRNVFWTKELLGSWRSKIQGDFDFLSEKFKVELDTSLPSGELGARFSQDALENVVDRLSESIDRSVLSSILHDLS